jgi:NAD(P)-dependent dehydrogenase (short-subunit alcohol dehydrogenase family)
MLLRKRGLIVNVSSDAAVEPYPGWGAYGASKAALDHLTRILAAELAGSGVRAIAVDPGEMDTEMHAAAIPDADPSTLARPHDVARRVADLVAAVGTRPEEARLTV